MKSNPRAGGSQLIGGIGFAFSDAGRFADLQFKELARASAHGVTGGTVAELAGGEFGAGFAGAFSGSLMAHLGPQWNDFYVDTIQASIAGGAASSIAGGSFENGAVTAAFQTMFNKGVHSHAQRNNNTVNLSLWDKFKEFIGFSNGLPTTGWTDVKKMFRGIYNEYKDGSGFISDFRQGWSDLTDYPLQTFGDMAIGAGVPALGNTRLSVFTARIPDYFRVGNTVVSNQLIYGSGTPGATVTWAIRGGGRGMNFHYHIHRYNWYKPFTWTKNTPIIRPLK